MKNILLVFAGGGIGTVVRYLLGRWITSMHQLNFPFGTLTINVVACFVLGLIIGFSDHRHLLSADARLFWTIGFCGGFSTFSTFANETLELSGPNPAAAFLYVAVGVIFCVLAVYVGLALSR